MDIKFMRLDRQYLSIKNTILRDIDEVLSSGQVLQSKHVTEIERQVSELHGASFGIGVNSGTDAIKLSLRACGISAGHKVLTTPLSFIASSSAIISLGASPVFADVSDDMHSDPQKYLEIMHTKKIDALLLVHLYGRLYDYSEVIDEANRLSIPVIEDCAQAFGANSGGRRIGEHVDVACLSFDPMKVMAAYGSAGMVLTNSKHIDAKVRKLRYHGRDETREYVEVGDNSQLSSIQASILLAKLKQHSVWTHKRIEIAKRYNEAIKDISSMRPVEQGSGHHVFHKYVMLVEEPKRDGLVEYLKKNGIGSAIHYSTPLHKVSFIENKIGKLTLPNVEKFCKMTLSLPIYAELTDLEVDHICETLRRFVG